MSGAVPPAIALDGVGITFGGSFLRRAKPFRALDNVTLAIPRGEIHGLVGESGSGKSTLGRVILGLLRPGEGRVTVAGQDAAALRGADRLAFRRRVQCVFQDSAASLDPRMTLGAAIRQGLEIHRIGAPTQRDERVAAMLERVGLHAAMAQRFPHEISGGQRQRVNIARALILKPDILIADEPVSALDVSVQAQVLDVLSALHEQMGLTIVFISHDLMVVREICARLSVMEAGRIVETAPIEAIFDAPRHPSSAALLAAC